jgi:hypothetical protein
LKDVLANPNSSGIVTFPQKLVEILCAYRALTNYISLFSTSESHPEHINITHCLCSVGFKRLTMKTAHRMPSTASVQYALMKMGWRAIIFGQGDRAYRGRDRGNVKGKACRRKAVMGVMAGGGGRER